MAKKGDDKHGKQRKKAGEKASWTWLGLIILVVVLLGLGALAFI